MDKRVLDDRVEWYLNGYLHYVEWHNGTKTYHLDGKMHREDGPAYDGIGGEKKWYKNGLLHRENGPAITTPDGLERYYLLGVQMKKEDYLQIVRDDKLNKLLDGKV
jgi:hypothetical protein